MKTLIPYLVINDNCQQALEFYQHCLGGEIIFLQQYADTAYPVSAGYKNKVAHAEFRAEGVHFFASDGVEGNRVTVGENVALSITFSNQNEQKTTFEKMKVGGKVTMDFAETSANSTLVTLIDRFGIHWYLNFEEQPEVSK